MSTRPLGSRLAGARPRPLLGGCFLLVLFLSACATGVPPGGRMMGSRYRYRSLAPPLPPQEYVTFTPSSDFAPVQVSDTAFREAFTQLILEVPLRVASHPARPLAGRLVLASWPSGGTEGSSVEGGYARLCERRGSPGDCFWLLGEGPHDTLLSHRDRFALALSLALTPAVEAATGVLQDFSAHAMTALLTGLSLYLVVLMAPEPISKSLALAMTVFLWSYLGHELWGLISATKQLWDEAGAASTFSELHGASERYAQVLGPNTLRILILLATWKAGARGKEAMSGSGLPGFSQATRNAATVGGFRLPAAASEATSVSVVEGRLILMLPAGSGAILAMQNQGGTRRARCTTSPPWRTRSLLHAAGRGLQDSRDSSTRPACRWRTTPTRSTSQGTRGLTPRSTIRRSMSGSRRQSGAAKPRLSVGRPSPGNWGSWPSNSSM